MNILSVYKRKDIVVGLLIYGTGDAISSFLAQDASLSRLMGMALVGAFLYSLEIPNYFHWVERKTALKTGWSKVFSKTALAMLYFNPLWVARHIAFITFFSGNPLSFDLIGIGLSSFVAALPITISANLFIQNVVPLTHRFMASALFSCFMAIVYPLIALFLIS